jgi:hypothetical protein
MSLSYAHASCSTHQEETVLLFVIGSGVIGALLAGYCLYLVLSKTEQALVPPGRAEDCQ